jgi:dienelactone hydrolase
MFRLLPLTLLLLPLAVWGQAPSNKKEPLPGERMIENYFKSQTKEISQDFLKGIKSKADWEKARPELKRQLYEMLGLWPMPPKDDLKPAVTGKIEREKFTVEKIQFQSLPNLYVTANLYLPKPAPKNAPAILYVCGHGNVVKDGISFGSKVHYQHHPAWFAENGYVAIVIDTLQLSEIPGIHHGTYREKMWWWQTLGYTPAGIECWNGMRTLDYLATRPEVDMKRVGITGRSGGGAYSWWIAAADDRVSAIIPVAGIADLQAQLSEGYPGRLEKGVISGHCDCMFMINHYRWDFAQIAALCAPRPLLLANSDQDDIFPVAGYRRLADQVWKVYDLYGAKEKFQLLETKGPHTDTLELRIGAYRWMNRWLKNDTSEVREGEFKRFEPEELKVLSKTPEGALNPTIHDYFIKPATYEIPASPEVANEWWKGTREKLRTALKEQVFRNQPRNPPELKLKPIQEVIHEGMRLRAFDFTSENGIDLRLFLLTAQGVEKPKLIVLNALGETDWSEWCADLGPAFKESLLLSKEPKLNEVRFNQNKKVLEKEQWAYAAICPRGIGPTKWAEVGSTEDTQIRRRFALIGQTLDERRVWDVRRAVQAVAKIEGLADVPLWLQGKKELAGIALYTAIFEPSVKRLDLWNPPQSHREGPIFLSVRRHLDLPQSLALAAPTPVRLYVKNEAEAKAFAWTTELQKSLKDSSLQIRVVGE